MIEPFKVITITPIIYLNFAAEEFSIIDYVFIKELVNELVSAEMEVAKVEIYELLLNELLKRVPYDTDPKRESYNPYPHLRDVIKDNSIILNDTIYVGSGLIIPYASDLEQMYSPGPIEMWKRKEVRLEEGRMEDPDSTLPYMQTTINNNIQNIVNIICNSIVNALKNISTIQKMEVQIGSRENTGEMEVELAGVEE